MTTAAAIDRLVHHSVILELNLPSYRLEQAKETKKQGKQTDAKPTAAGDQGDVPDAGPSPGASPETA